MSRLTLEMTGQESIVAMCQGNPGAVNVLCQMVKNDDLPLLFVCDSLGLYGSELYMLWSDCCYRDYNLTKLALRTYTGGRITSADFLNNVRGDGRGLPFEKWEFTKEETQEEVK